MTNLIIGGHHHGHWLDCKNESIRTVRLACPETSADFYNYGMGGPEDCSMRFEVYVLTEFPTAQKDFKIWRHEKLNDSEVMEMLIDNFSKQVFIHI